MSESSNTPMRRFAVATPGGSVRCVRFGRGRPLLAVHALAYSKTYFEEAAEVLAPHFDCIAVDQRGHGESSPIREADELPDLVADLVAVLEHAGWREAVVGGISLGAAVTLRLAHDHPDRVSLLVQDLPAFAPGSAMDADTARRIARALEREDIEQALAHIAGDPPRGPGRALARALRADWARYPDLAPRLATAFAAIERFRVLDRWPADLARIDRPVRILALRGDPGHPWDVAETMHAHLPDSTLTPRVPSLSPVRALAQWAEQIDAGTR